MSAVPTEIADVGSTAQKLRQNPAFDALRAGLTTEDYFVWSRFDGATTLKDLLLMTGFPVEHAIAIVKRLRGLGAILLPGENPANLAARARPPTGPTPAPEPAREPVRPRPPTGPTPILTAAAAAAPPPTLDEPTPEEKVALAEPADKNELGAAERALVLAMQRRLRQGDPWLLLGVPRGTDKKSLKRSYFKLSKDFHPDRYYSKRLGSFAARLSEVFEALSHAYAELTEDRPAERPAEPGESAQAQTPAEYAAELFDRACAQEVAGAPDNALKLFDAAIHVDPQARYLKRAAGCALAAKQPRVAEEYAKKAAALEPQDPSTQRILARAFKASGHLALAEEVILMAMQLKNENDSLARELRTDLAEIRKLLARSQGF
jgi:tetratricopeptide (TPR) repeat protein